MYDISFVILIAQSKYSHKPNVATKSALTDRFSARGLMLAPNKSSEFAVISIAYAMISGVDTLESVANLMWILSCSFRLSMLIGPNCDISPRPYGKFDPVSILPDLI